MAKMREFVQELERRREHLKLGGGTKEIDRQHEKGKLTARERIELLLDKSSFIELDLWVSPRPTGFDIDGKEMPDAAFLAQMRNAAASLRPEFAKAVGSEEVIKMAEKTLGR